MRPAMPKFTPVQQRIISMLSDGMQHSPLELSTCLWDELGGPVNVANHIKDLRKLLRPIGQDIICETEGRHGTRRTFYRHVRVVGIHEPFPQ